MLFGVVFVDACLAETTQNGRILSKVVHLPIWEVCHLSTAMHVRHRLDGLTDRMSVI